MENMEMERDRDVLETLLREVGQQGIRQAGR